MHWIHNELCFLIRVPIANLNMIHYETVAFVLGISSVGTLFNAFIMVLAALI